MHMYVIFQYLVDASAYQKEYFAGKWFSQG